jgi:general secretion pathway protein D
MSKQFRKVPVLLFLLLVVTFSLIPPSADSQAMVNIDYSNVDIREFIKIIAKQTGNNFLIGGKVKGNVTIVSPTPVTLKQAYQVFLTVLDSMGFTVIKSGQVYQVVQSANAKGSNLPIYFGRGYSGTDLTITRIIPMEYVDAAELIPYLQDFLSKTALIKAYNATNSLIIIDSGRNIDKIMRLIEEFDSPRGTAEVEIIPIKHSTASAIADLLLKIYDTAGKAKPKTTSRRSRGKKGSEPAEVAGLEGAESISKIIPDDRTNSLIVIATSGELSSLRELIAKLDVPEPEAGGTIHVVYLENADAEEMATTLNALAAGSGRAAPSKGKGASAQATAQFESGVKITAHKPTNSLVIIATKNDVMTLQRVIDKLDIPRRQVFVEALILEVSLDKSREFGLTGHFGSTIMGGDGLALGATGVGTLTMLENPAGVVGSGLTAAIVGKPVTLEGDNYSLTLPAVGALLKAAQNDSGINILSNPHLLTSDNEEATIVIGENVPFITGQSTTTGGNVMTQIERKDVGITLTITPQINESDYIKLSISQEISNVSASSSGLVDVNQQGLITRKRSAKTTVVVGDRQTVVIGGLIQDSISESETKVPILGDIPILGWLFRSTTKQSSKTNLVILITPYIVKNDEDILRYSLKKEDLLMQFRRRYGVMENAERHVLRSYLERTGVMQADPPIEGYISPELQSMIETNASEIEPATPEPTASGPTPAVDDFGISAEPSTSDGVEVPAPPSSTRVVPGQPNDGNTPEAMIPAPPENLRVTPEGQ